MSVLFFSILYLLPNQKLKKKKKNSKEGLIYMRNIFYNIILRGHNSLQKHFLLYLDA